MEKWMVAAKKADFNAIAQKYGITPVLARIMRNRDLTEDEEIRLFLKGTLADRPSPFALYGMEKAAELLLLKIREEKKIRVIGDYDVDGICSTYILCRGIQALSGKADRVIPHRIRDGYGLNISLIENAREDEVDTILTCDNGIAAFEEISLARDYGMTVIVTDHHEVPYTEENGNKEYHLPPADVVVDPKQSADTSHFKGICGALIAYKLIEALCEKSGEEEKKKSLQKELLPFAALATVCDVMELRDENRIIVKYGMQQMKETENPGLLALLQVNDLMDKELSPYHAGFILGPCLNATGRLDSADRALRLFEETDFKKAVTEAYDLKSLNDSRKQMTEDGVSEAVRMLEAEGREQDPVLVVYLPDCHESIAGIIAGRLKEKYHKPVLVATRAEEGIKGSGRSIEAYSMYEELSKCRELFTKFGGHKMAAGFSLAGEGDLK
ncbi:MAG: single-stranded-DNA-specific exonuclease RecJ [Lachnospiraceae bacterium]